jgi:DSF synthase
MNAQVALALEHTGAFAPSAARAQIFAGRQFELTSEATSGALWQVRLPTTTPHVSLAQLKEARAIDERISAGLFGELYYKVLVSKQPGVFSLGGDLEFFCHCIEAGARAALSEYALLAAKAIWGNVSAYGSRRVISVALVQGEAQGGGFEAALSCNTLVAERGSCFGFPESLFGMFPGMGGELLLRSRVDPSVAERIVSSCGRYSAEFLYEIGVVDYLVAPGTGAAFVADLLTQMQSDANCSANLRVRQRQELLDAIRYDSLANSIERWTEQALSLTPRQIRSMKYIVELQGRRSS